MGLSNVESMSRLCGACLEETAVLVVRFETDELVWVCPHCSYLELSGLDEQTQLFAPNAEELRELMSHELLGPAIRDLQKTIRLGKLVACGTPTVSEVTQPPQPAQRIPTWCLQAAKSLLDVVVYALVLKGLMSFLET